VIQIHGKAMRVLQGRSEPPRHSKQPSQPSSHPPLTYPRARYVKGRTSVDKHLGGRMHGMTWTMWTLDDLCMDLHSTVKIHLTRTLSSQTTEHTTVVIGDQL